MYPNRAEGLQGATVNSNASAPAHFTGYQTHEILRKWTSLRVPRLEKLLMSTSLV